MAVDLGSLIPGAADSAKQTWQGLVDDPVSRAAMMSFGLQLMAGGPPGSNGMQQVAQAGGKAAESSNASTDAMLHQQNIDVGRADKNTEGAANRASHEKVAGIAADSRSEVANIRSEASIERARMIARPQNSQEMTIYSKAMADYMKKEKDNQIISKKSDSTIQMEADAWAKSVLDNARSASGVRSQGAPLPDDGARLGGPEVPSGVGSATGQPAAQSGGSTQPSVGEKSAPNEWNSYYNNLKPDQKKQLAEDPGAREAVGNKWPQFRSELAKLAGNKKPDDNSMSLLYQAHKLTDKYKNPNSDYTTPGTVLP